jgi:hypothetical protein
VGTDPQGSPVTGTVDKRLSNFIVGKINGADGFSPLNDAGADRTDPDGPQINHTPHQ